MQTFGLAKLGKNVITHDAVFSACEKGQQWQLAISLWAEMGLTRIVRNVITYSLWTWSSITFTLLSVCEKAQRWQPALCLLADMAIAKVDRDVVTCNTAISSVEKCLERELALGLFSEMPLARVDKNVMSHSAITV